MSTLWRDVATDPPPRDGRELLMKMVRDDGTEFVRVCYPKAFPRPLSGITDVRMIEPRPGDTWEYFRDDKNAPGHSWSMVPTHWMEIPS